MSLNVYLSNHLIIQGNINSLEYICSEAIVDNPEELIFTLLKTQYYISHISWWDYVQVGNTSPIGYGGTRDPRNANYYFAETDICRDFDSDTTTKQYCDYIMQINEIYSKYSIIPAFDIKSKTGSCFPF